MSRIAWKTVFWGPKRAYLRIITACVHWLLSVYFLRRAGVPFTLGLDKSSLVVWVRLALQCYRSQFEPAQSSSQPAVMGHETVLRFPNGLVIDETTLSLYPTGKSTQLRTVGLRWVLPFLNGGSITDRPNETAKPRHFSCQWTFGWSPRSRPCHHRPCRLFRSWAWCRRRCVRCGVWLGCIWFLSPRCNLSFPSRTPGTRATAFWRVPCGLGFVAPAGQSSRKKYSPCFVCRDLLGKVNGLVQEKQISLRFSGDKLGANYSHL